VSQGSNDQFVSLDRVTDAINDAVAAVVDSQYVVVEVLTTPVSRWVTVAIATITSSCHSTAVAYTSPPACA
jgi:hypothetical protein